MMEKLRDYFRLRKLKRSLASGSYEPSVTNRLKNLEGTIFVDVGANVGYYTLLLAKNFDIVYAFEPVPKILEKLRWHTKKLKAYNVFAFQLAISDHNGIDEMALIRHCPPKDDPSTPTQYGSPDEEIDTYSRNDVKNAKGAIVQTVTLTSFFRERPYFSGTLIDLVKVDVEGYEWKVLKGAEPIIHNVKSWVIELHDSKRRKELEDYLGSFGYSFKWLDEQHIIAER